MVEKVDLMKGGIKEAGQPNSQSDTKEQQEIKMIKQWKDEATRNRSPYDKKWEQYYRAYYGKTWKNKKADSTKPEINIIRPAVQTIVPIMTDAKPGFTVIPKTLEDVAFTEMLSEMVESLWQNQDMLIKMVEVITEMCIVDASILKVSWNTELQDGLGDVDIEPIDIGKIWVNKECVDFNRKFKYVIEEVTKTVGEWKTLFPKYADKIKPDSQLKDSNENKTGDIKGAFGDGETTLVSPVDQDRNKNADPMKGESNFYDNQVATGWEVWYVDDAVDEYIENDGQDDERKILKKRFPNGHLTTMLPNQNLILQSTQNPYLGDRQNPYVKFVDTVVPRKFYGQGEAEVLMDSQYMLNRTTRVITEYLRLMANPVWILDKNSGVNTQALTNKISLIIKKEPGTDVKRDFPESIPPYVFEWFNTLMRIADMQSGVQDVTQGRKPVGVTAAEAIETLQEAAQTRIRLKDRNLENSLNQLGKLITNMILQYYRGVRYQRVAGESEENPDFIEFTIEPIDAEGNPIAESEGAAGFQMKKGVTAWDVESQQYVELPSDIAKTDKTTFDFKIKSGTSLPFQKAQKGQKAIQLFDRGAIDRKELLDSFEWPKSEEVLGRIQKQEQAQAQAAQEQAVQAQQQGVQ